MKVRTDWFQILDHNPKNLFATLSGAQQHFRAQLDPFLRDYISPLQGFFVSSVRDLKELNQRQVWLARDGILPLLFFFNQFKRPKNLKSKILIREDLLECVPEAWQPHIGSYRIVSVTSSPQPKSVFVYGMNTESLVSVKSCEVAMKDLDKIEISGLEKIYLYLPSRRFSVKESEHEAAKVLLTVLKKTSLQAEIVDWAEVLPTHDWKTCQIVNVQKNTVVADDWLLHTLLTRGASLVSEKMRNSEEFVYFSPFHGCAFNLKPSWKKTRPKEYDNYLREHMSSVEMSSFEWFQIFAGK